MREEEEYGDAMKGLENKTGDSKREMEILEAIDEIEEINKRYIAISPDDIFKKISQVENDEQNDDYFIEKYFELKKSALQKQDDQKKKSRVIDD